MTFEYTILGIGAICYVWTVYLLFEYEKFKLNPIEYWETMIKLRLLKERSKL